jgi:signal transduction histidine kinase
MFYTLAKKTVGAAPPPPVGVSEVVFCVFDEKQRLHHHFQSERQVLAEPDAFPLLDNPPEAFKSGLLTEAVASRNPASFSLSYGEGWMKNLHVLPYERKWGKWRFACVQLSVAPPDPDGPVKLGTVAQDRICFLLVDPAGTIRSAGSKVPKDFGYSAGMLVGMTLADLFAEADMGIIGICSADTNEPIHSCVLHCLNGSRCDVELKKYSAPDHLTLYAVCDVTRPQFLSEEISQVTTRERRRIGQDLHDSIGQLLTGISLLSRSLANGLNREGNSADADAAQISELADDASNQIRQISRGLMTSDVVQLGFFSALRKLARVTAESCGLRCEVQIDETLEFADGAVETHLFRIAQEAVNNAVRHSGATLVEILVAKPNGMPQLTVQDNGHWRNIMENGGGIGMKTMQYRASAINGQLNIKQTENGGTQLVCSMEVDELLDTKA